MRRPAINSARTLRKPGDLPRIAVAVGKRGALSATSYLSVAPRVCSSSCAITTLFSPFMIGVAKRIHHADESFVRPNEWGTLGHAGQGRDQHNMRISSGSRALPLDAHAQYRSRKLHSPWRMGRPALRARAAGRAIGPLNRVSTGSPRIEMVRLAPRARRTIDGPEAFDVRASQYNAASSGCRPQQWVDGDVQRLAPQVAAVAILPGR